MNIRQKVRAAWTILRHRGPVELAKAILAGFRVGGGASGTDESKIAFDALEADTFNGLMIDVGAHFGSSLRPFAYHGWRVYAFEPDSSNRKVLMDKFGNLPNVMIDDRAVSDELRESATLFRSTESTGISGLSAFNASHTAAEEVPVTTIERFMAENALTDEPIDFLKVDTEGFDLNVLKGVAWQTSRPRFILCEFEDTKSRRLGYGYHDIAKFLMGKGYRIVVSEWYPIKRYGGPHDWRRFAVYPCELEDTNGWGNLMATTDEHVFTSLVCICSLNRDAGQHPNA